MIEVGSINLSACLINLKNSLRQTRMVSHQKNLLIKNFWWAVSICRRIIFRIIILVDFVVMADF
ncbi:hypothetical protein AT245_01500 [Bartonella henselae]|nr:hypothetical protein AT244_07195 [Bartonella henselae]OLL44190.1 hypothetical protein AT245_01500 [Bartonella henselae]